MQFKRSRLTQLLKWITPKINKEAWRRLSEDCLKLDSCLQGCPCGGYHCDETCPVNCSRHCTIEQDDRRRWEEDFLYVRRFMPPCVRAVNYKKCWVMDEHGRLRGPYTYQSWLRYGYWALDTFHDSMADKKDILWHQVYFRNELDYYGGIYNHFYPIHFLLIWKLEGLEEKHHASNIVTRGFDVYHNILPRDKDEAVRIRNAGTLFTTPEPHFENLRHFHQMKKRPLEAELYQWEKEDKIAKTKFVKKNARKVLNWFPDPEGLDLSSEEAQKEADRRFDLWYPKNRNVPLFIPRTKNKVIAPAFPTKKELEQKYFKFNIKTLELWMRTGAIYMLKPTETPDLVVPAVYASMDKKPRMCVDGGWIKQLEAYSLRCHLEDLPMALVTLSQNSYLTKCDDKRGFHLLRLGKEGRKLTAFGLFGEYWEYRVAAFGIPGSPGVFQLANQIAVNYGRCYGIEWQVYLDDRLMVDFLDTIVRRKNQLHPQNAIKGLLLILAHGGVISLDKSELVPTTKIQFLGMDLNTREGTISVPEEKWLKFITLLRKTDPRIRKFSYRSSKEVSYN